MTGATPEGRRSGDVGGAGLLTNLQPNFSHATPKDAAILRQPPVEQNPPRKGELNAPTDLPFAKRKGTRASEARSQGMPGAVGRGDITAHHSTSQQSQFKTPIIKIIRHHWHHSSKGKP